MDAIDNNLVLDILRSITDPVTGHDLISARRIDNFTVRGNIVGFSLKTHQWDASQRQAVNFACQESIKEKYPNAEVHIHMVTQKQQGSDSETLPQVKNIIAVASGKGGVGKSTVSVNLAKGLQRAGYKVGILDADLYGPSIPIMMGLEGQRPKMQKLYGKPKIVPLEKDDIHVISIGFIVEPEQAVVMRGPRLSGVIKQFVNECLWPELDYLIIDLPPGTGDIQLTLVQTIPVTGVVMVTTPQKVAVADALKAMNMFLMPNIKVPILGVVENMSWFTPAELPDNKYLIFGEGGGKSLARFANSMILGQVPLIMGIRESADHGKGVYAENNPESWKGYFDTIVENTIKQVNIRNEMLGPTSVVQVEK